MRRRARCHARPSCLPVCCVAFGVGVILALFCSIKLVAVLAGIGLIVLGIRTLKR